MRIFAGRFSTAESVEKMGNILHIVISWNLAWVRWDGIPDIGPSLEVGYWDLCG